MSIQIACLAFILAVLGAGPAHADEAIAWSRRVTVGAHIGVDFATLGGSELDDMGVDYSYKSGIVGGGVLTAKLSRVFAARIELDFVAKGFRGETDFASTSGTQHMSYLEIPILVQAAVPALSTVEPYAYGGPAVGMLLDAHIEFDDGNSLELARAIKRFDVGVMLGAGIAVDMRELGALTLDARYNLGLRDWGTNEDSDNTVLNRAIYFTVGYRADLATLGRLFGRGARRGPAEPAGAAPEAAPESPAGSRR